jgi:hypothetical protein
MHVPFDPSSHFQSKHPPLSLLFPPISPSLGSFPRVSLFPPTLASGRAARRFDPELTDRRKAGG